jgi:Protein of unknown function (DUF3631)
MRRRHQGQQVEQFRRRIHLAEGERIRSMIKSWALLAEFEIVAPENLPANIQDRDADVWESLITVADAVGGEWPARARAAAVALVSESKEREPSLGVRLLADLKEIFGHAQEITTEAILRALHALNESPWNDLKGKPLNDRGLAQRLRQYEIKPRVLGVGSHRGYRREDLHDAKASARYMKQYLRSLRRGSFLSVEGSATADSLQHRTQAAVVGNQKRAGRRPHEYLDAGTAGKPFQLGEIFGVVGRRTDKKMRSRNASGDGRASPCPPGLRR